MVCLFNCGIGIYLVVASDTVRDFGVRQTYHVSGCAPSPYQKHDMSIQLMKRIYLVVDFDGGLGLV